LQRHPRAAGRALVLRRCRVLRRASWRFGHLCSAAYCV
jgi:hypothetical protein